jgi:hypothetical protein
LNGDQIIIVKTYIDERGTSDIVCYTLEGELERMAKESTLSKPISTRYTSQQSAQSLREVARSFRVLALFLGQESRESQNIGLDLLGILLVGHAARHDGQIVISQRLKRKVKYRIEVKIMSSTEWAGRSLL